MVVVNDLDERLNLVAFVLCLLGHSAGDLRWVAFDTCNESVGIWVRLVSGVLGLDDHDLPDCPSAFRPRNPQKTEDHFQRPMPSVRMFVSRNRRGENLPSFRHICPE